MKIKILAVLILLGLLPKTTSAQSSAVKNAAKAVFTLTTFRQDGSILASTHGIFIDANGEAVSNWKPFVGATRAIVIDANGKQFDVETIVGANELYNVCKFRTKSQGQTAPLETEKLKAGDKAWLAGYAVNKTSFMRLTIDKVELFADKYAYYIVGKTALDTQQDGCPLVNDRGKIVALLQMSDNGEAHAIDVNYLNSFNVVSGLSMNDPVLRQTHIRTALPDKEDQALVALMLASQKGDTDNYAKTAADFVHQFPQNIEGYTAQAQLAMNAKNYQEVDNIMAKAQASVTNKAEAHAAYARFIRQKAIIGNTESPYPAWTLDKALQEAQTANKLNPSPLYRHLEAQIFFDKGEYLTAYNTFMELAHTNLRNGELFYEAAQAKMKLQAPKEEIMTLLDSAVVANPKPLNAMSAQYVLARGTYLAEIGEYRKAVTDFNEYDSIMAGRPISSQFYYLREQCEMQIRQYQQALNDIARAIILTPKEPTYWAEKANIHLRVNQLDEAVQSAEHCIQLAPDMPDAYLIKGLALIQKKEKDKGLEVLQKAKELGDSRAEEFIHKYK